MKIYGVTFIDTDDNLYKNSETKLFTTQDEQLEYAWAQFNESYEEDLSNDKIDTSIDDCHALDKKVFFSRMMGCGYDYYVRWDSSYQVETFEQEL